jgi:hypothetical protein
MAKKTAKKVDRRDQLIDTCINGICDIMTDVQDESISYCELRFRLNELYYDVQAEWKHIQDNS